MAVLNILVLMAAVGIATVKSTCVTVSCGDPGFFLDVGPRRQLQPGQVTVETVDPYLCSTKSPYNKVVGFDAYVCTDTSVPTASCTTLRNELLVNKNGAYAGTIQFTAHCGADGSPEEKVEPTHLSSHHGRHRYYDDRRDRYHSDSRYNSYDNRHY